MNVVKLVLLLVALLFATATAATAIIRSAISDRGLAQEEATVDGTPLSCYKKKYGDYYAAKWRKCRNDKHLSYNVCTKKYC